MPEQTELKRSFSHSEMQELIRQLNDMQINGEKVFNVREGNWKTNGLYITIETVYSVVHVFLPISG